MADRNEPGRPRKRRKKDQDDVDSQDEVERMKSRAAVYKAVVKELAPSREWLAAAVVFA
jgi:hypothetical protein